MAIGHGIDALTANLFGALSTSQGHGNNLFFSPFSIVAALSLLYHGATGSTRDEIARVLGYEGSSPQEVGAWFSKLLGDLQTIPEVDRRVLEEWEMESSFVGEDAGPKPVVEPCFTVAHSLWCRGIEYAPEFLAVARGHYGAEIGELPAEPAAAAEKVNAWVSDETRGKITELFDTISVSSLLLVNAVYFNGRWQHVFDEDQTAPRPFRCADGREVEVAMMSLPEPSRMLYRRDDTCQVIGLPYTRRGLFMFVFLPHEGRDFDQFLAGLDLSGMVREARQMFRDPRSDLEGTICLPRFRIEYESSLGDSLRAVGIEQAFDPDRADLTAMVTGLSRIWVDAVTHKAFVDVTETGTEAAAATAVALSFGVPDLAFEVVVDRPFVFTIIDVTVGQMLFAGTLVDPEVVSTRVG